jgi:hypothetical protein
MDELLLKIKEVQEGGKRLANHLLDRGYILLDIQNAARSRQYNPHDDRGNAQLYYVHRNPVYVLGRPEGVEPAEPLVKKEIDNEPGEKPK